MNAKMILPAFLAMAITGTVFTGDATARPHHGAGPDGPALEAQAPRHPAMHKDRHNRGPKGMGCCYQGNAGPKVEPMFRPWPGMDDGQRKKHRAIVGEFAPKMDELKDQLFIKKEELRALHAAPTPDVKAVRDTATEITKLRQQLRSLKRDMASRMEREFPVPPREHRAMPAAAKPEASGDAAATPAK